MAEKLINTKKAVLLFGDWEETLIWSCLQDVMGDIYADCNENPKSAMAVIADFCFLAGKPDRELLHFIKESGKREFLIMVPQNEEWAKIIEECFGDKAKAVTRYALRKEPRVFDKEKLEEAAASPKSGYELRMMDKESYEQCRSMEWSRDLVSQFQDYEAYRESGIGVVALKAGKLAAGASSYTRYREGIEIEIDTEISHRRQGLAYACAAKLILECRKRNLYPSWDAQNKASAALAEKLGYHPAYEYPAYEVSVKPL